MRRFFINTPLSAEMCIEGNDAHHISRVLRMNVGDNISVVSVDGSSAIAQITAITVDKILLSLKEEVSESKEAPINISLAQGLPKSDKMDYIVQKVTELGIANIYPMETEHCVVQYDNKKKLARCTRWQKIAEEAAKQCKRSIVPSIKNIQSLAEILESVPTGTVIIMLYEGPSSLGIKELLAEHKSKDYLFLVGPEGGFSPKEVELCMQKGVHIVNMGPRILRTETAAIAGLAVIMYEYGDLGG